MNIFIFWLSRKVIFTQTLQLVFIYFRCSNVDQRPLMSRCCLEPKQWKRHSKQLSQANDSWHFSSSSSSSNPYQPFPPSFPRPDCRTRTSSCQIQVYLRLPPHSAISILPLFYRLITLLNPCKFWHKIVATIASVNRMCDRVLFDFLYHLIWTYMPKPLFILQ